MLSEKKRVRNELRRKRKAISSDERHLFERQLRNNLLPLIKRGRKIAVYLSFGSEANLLPWMRYAQKKGCRIFVPFIDKKQLRLWFTEYEFDNSTLHSRAYFGIPQFQGRKYRAEQLDVILLPLLGIDKHGYRMGQGGGFYDSTLKYCAHRTFRPKLIGVGFSCQTVDALPIDPWDIQLDAYVSEKGAYHFHENKKIFIDPIPSL